MAQGKNTTGLTDLLLKCMTESDPMLSMLEWLCAQLMEAEVCGIVGAEKNIHSPSAATIAVAIAGGWIPHGRCISWCQRCCRGYIRVLSRSADAARRLLIQVIQEAFVQGVSTRKMEKLARPGDREPLG